jgi:hypothetical protein
MELGINLDKHAEIQLIDRKLQIYSKNLETPRRKLKCCLLHVKNVLRVYKVINFQVTS